MNKENEISQAIRIGGTVLAASATLRIFGELLEPKELTRLLGSSPTKSYRAGDLISPRLVARRKIGMWQLESRLPRTEPLSRQVTELLAPLPADGAIWEGLAARLSLDVYCVVDVRLPNSGMELTAAAIAALAARGLTVQFEFYALPAEANDSGDEPDRLIPT